MALPRLRFRRYRVLVAAVALALLVVYRLSSNALTDAELAAARSIIYKGYAPPVPDPNTDTDAGLPKFAGGAPQNSAAPQATNAAVPASAQLDAFDVLEPPAPTPAPDAGMGRLHRVDPPGALQESYALDPDESAAAAKAHKPVPTTSAIHWQKLPEHFPVPPESIIPLPTGAPRAIPRIQHDFSPEPDADKTVREARLAAVRAEMQHAWTGYRTHAWTHDELAPVSNSFKDPFCGWAATMVDALDTLWIMGLSDEFDEAYAAVQAIDFTTTPHRTEIPVFETIIRYLGGLVAAYDVSGGAAGRYPALLTKAVELAEILMGVFDTPNRMPVLYYNWKPAFVSQPSVASTSASIAELGSMTLEFTRLAQLTGDDRYYDAVARIGNALADLQDRNVTAIPGIFPEHIDASGCNRTAAALKKAELANDEIASELAQAQIAEDVPIKVKKPKTDDEFRNLYRRDSFDARPIRADGSAVDPACIPMPLTISDHRFESFSMGGSQDSTYEYFSKQYLLLGGLEPQYRRMHERAADAVTEYLLYRPMVPDNDRPLLFSAKAISHDHTDSNLVYTYEATHLTCFLGGMYAMGGRVFGRDDDVEIGRRLADGCAWAYEAMPSGLMPESAELVPCDDADACAWNETAWHDAIDGNRAYREKQMRAYEAKLQQWQLDTDRIQRLRDERAAKKAAAKEHVSDVSVVSDASAEPAEPAEPAIEKRTTEIETDLPELLATPAVSEDAKKAAVDAKEDALTAAILNQDAPAVAQDLVQPFALPDDDDEEVNLVPPPMPRKPESHAAHVASRIAREGLQPGFVGIDDRRYILRPEAIESVWYLYRITGDPAWQAKGWRMFEAVVRATRTKTAHSGVLDVTANVGAMIKTNGMESFWLAETLKYFYLLFAPPDTISLDEYVLNTEAHPFKRPV